MAVEHIAVLLEVVGNHTVPLRLKGLADHTGAGKQVGKGTVRRITRDKLDCPRQEIR